MTKKYEFTGETKTVEGVTLKRIRRLSDGLVGGWIEKEENLSHGRACFVYDNAQVFGNAWVYGDARVYGNAQVYGYAQVFGNVQVYGYAWVYGYAQVFGNAQVYEKAEVYGNARVFENVRVTEKHHTVNITNLEWNFTSLPKGVQVGCGFLSLKEWKEQHVDIGLENGLTEEEAKAYYQLMRAVRRIQRLAELKSKKT